MRIEIEFFEHGQALRRTFSGQVEIPERTGDVHAQNLTADSGASGRLVIEVMEPPVILDQAIRGSCPHCQKGLVPVLRSGLYNVVNAAGSLFPELVHPEAKNQECSASYLHHLKGTLK